jgi:transposase
MALTRKNALFAGHDLGAESWAMIASLIETASSTQSIRSRG